MVRLKDVSLKHWLITELFQFLYGAIKSKKPLLKHRTDYLFQFLYGAIKRRNEIVRRVQVNVFQFLYGAIKRKRPLYRLGRYMEISIPVWCD